MDENAYFTENTEIEINVLSLIKELLRKWYIIAAAAVCCTLLFGVYTFITADRNYTSTTSAYLLSKTDRSTAITTAELNASATLAADFVQIVGSTDTMKGAIDKLGLSMSPAALKNAVNVSNISGNRVVTISVSDKNAEQAQKIVQAILEVANEKAASISSTLYVEVVNQPSLPTTRSKPDLKKRTMMGFLLGFVLACLYIAAKWLIRKPIWDETDLEDYFKVPVLGSITAKKDKV